MMKRNPEDYLAKQKAQEEEERLEKSKYQRRYGSDKRLEKDITKRRSHIPTTAVDEDTQKASEYRHKRRSLNLDNKSDNSKTDTTSGYQKRNRKWGREKKSEQSELTLSTDNVDSFSPDNASSLKVKGDTTSGATSHRSATSPPRPSTKRKAAPPPPSEPVKTTVDEEPPVKTQTPSVAQVDSPQSKIPKPVTNREPLNSKPSTHQKQQDKLLTVKADSKTKEELSVTEPRTNDKEPVLVETERDSKTLAEIEQPSRPPRRKKKSVDKLPVDESTELKQNRQSQEIFVNKDYPENSIAKPDINGDTNIGQSVLDDLVHGSCKENEESLLNTVLKELPALNSGKPLQNDSITAEQTHEQHLLINGVIEETIAPAIKSGVECEVKPVIVDKPRGILIETDISSVIEFRETVSETSHLNHVDSDEEQTEAVNSNEHRISSDDDEPDDYLDHIQPVAYSKKTDDLQQAFEKIISLPETGKGKDTRDTISIASDISVSSNSSEAPPLPDTAPPSLPLVDLVELRESVEGVTQEVDEVIEPSETVPSESSPVMADVMSEKASPRAVTSPVEELKASVFSMRVTSPTRHVGGEVHTDEELMIDTGRGRKDSHSDSDVSDDNENVNHTGTFSPGERVTKEVPIETHSDDGGIQLISYNAKLSSPTSDQSAPDSAFEDMQSSMTSNDPLSNTLDELNTEEYITAEKVEKVESTPQKEVKSFILEFDSDRPKSGVILSPTGNKDFMAKAQQFADSVQRPPKMTVKRKKEITSPDDLTDERYLQLEAERRAVISSSTVKKKDIVVATNYDEDSPVDNHEAEDPDNAVHEWRSEVSKRNNIPWEEKPDKVNLYSDNIIQETENTEAVDRESIANLSRARQHWESRAQTPSGNSTPRKQKQQQQPQQVRHWEVKLPTQLKRVPANVVHSTKPDSDSESENMADTEYSNESAIEREIRLAMEREELLKREQEERANLQERQMSPLKKEPFEKSIEQNNNKPTYHEMTEADRGSELQQREELIQLEIQEQEEREAAIRGSNIKHQDSSLHFSGDEDENSNESIIEREIRLQREREQELEQSRQQVTTTTMQDTEPEEVEEVVTVEYTEEVHTSLHGSSSHSGTPASTPDNLSETEGETKHESKMRISYEEAISGAAHEGESLIARELREAREREEELKRLRQLTAGGVSKPSQPQKQMASPNVKETVVERTDSPKPSYQKDVGPYKHERKNSGDSLSSGHSSDKPQSGTPKNVRVATFGGSGKIGAFTYKMPDKPKERQETPIEREIRLARERENEFRIAKGLPPLKDEVKAEYDTASDKEEKVHVTASSFFSHGTPAKAEYTQKFASSRLQKEINKQTELEKKYRDEGKIISTSEEHVGLLKYTDIAQQEHTTPPKRNFSITRKHEAVVEQNGTTEPKDSMKVQTPEQPTQKFNRSVSTGGVTFSYKESKHKAESKIEQELREMREREEELRSRRTGTGIVSPSSPRGTDSTSVVDKRSHFEQTS